MVLLSLMNFIDHHDWHAYLQLICASQSTLNLVEIVAASNFCNAVVGMKWPGSSCISGIGKVPAAPPTCLCTTRLASRRRAHGSPPHGWATHPLRFRHHPPMAGGALLSTYKSTPLVHGHQRRTPSLRFFSAYSFNYLVHLPFSHAHEF
jgi:hypothetical protein